MQWRSSWETWAESFTALKAPSLPASAGVSSAAATKMPQMGRLTRDISHSLAAESPTAGASRSPVWWDPICSHTSLLTPLPCPHWAAGVGALGVSPPKGTDPLMRAPPC